MNSRPLYKPREPGSLKSAVAELVTACGGQGPSAELSRVSRSQIARYTDDSGEHETVQMPADIVLALERACGDPVVTRYLAGVQGHALIDLKARTDEPYGVVLARVGKETGELFAAAAQALSDRRMDRREAGRVKHEAMQLMAACAGLLRDLPAEAEP